jgi:sugar-specific transcriptional regulator TrmB
MADVPPEVRKEFEKWLDDYIEQYRKAIDRLLRSRDRRSSQARAAADG